VVRLVMALTAVLTTETIPQQRSPSLSPRPLQHRYPAQRQPWPSNARPRHRHGHRHRHSPSLQRQDTRARPQHPATNAHLQHIAVKATAHKAARRAPEPLLPQPLSINCRRQLPRRPHELVPHPHPHLQHLHTRGGATVRGRAWRGLSPARARKMYGATWNPVAAGTLLKSSLF